MHRPLLPLTGCIGLSACIARRAPARRSGYSCKRHSHNRGHRSTRRCSRLPNRRRLRCGNSSTDHRRRNHCQRRPSLRHSGCTVKTTCTAPRERVHSMSSSLPTWCPRRCHSCRRDLRSIECRPSMRRQCCGSSCARRRRLCRCWHRRPIRRSDYIRWSTCMRSRATALPW